MADDIETRLKKVEDFAAMINQALELFKKISKSDLAVETSSRETTDTALGKQIAEFDKRVTELEKLPKRVGDLEKRVPKK